ncbi:MAG: putative 5,10-methylenetetrahydromethanopterin reductase [Labilithrix sp.]|nr:putative 5,10-methylenetetrahydromethanopterin reductase [Labilithrix sp.]
MAALRIGFHASHEQHTPRDLLDLVRDAERAGFAEAMCSDHFSPFSEQQGQSGFAWSWLGAALQATKLSFGTVSAPGYRYHPAILAQAAATLTQMFPGRFWVALASGQLLNEHIVGPAWPTLDERRARLRECAEIIRDLLRGETVTRHSPVRIQEAKLYTRPETPPLLFAAAVSPESAALAGGWADGLVTVNQPRDVLRRVVEAFRDNGGAGKPMRLQAHVAWAKTRDEAMAAAHANWKTNVVVGPVQYDVPSAAHLDAAAAYVRPEDLEKAVRISDDLGQHRAWIAEDAELGFETVYLHEVGLEQRRFIETFGAHVLPAFT